MAKKKPARKKSPAAKKSPVRGKTPARKPTPVAKKKLVHKKKPAPETKRVPIRTRSPRVSSLDVATPPKRRGLGASSAGQSGDTQGLSRATDVDSESVEELLEEGQSLEASVVGGVEHADADEGEVRTTQVLEDDVPREYDDD